MKSVKTILVIGFSIVLNEDGLPIASKQTRPKDTKQSTDIVLINLEALKAEPKGSRHTSPEPTHIHPNIPTVKVWGTEAEMFTAKDKNVHEQERLMTKTSMSDDEVSVFSDNEQDVTTCSKSLIYKNKLNDVELHSLSSLEDEGPSFAASCLVVSDYDKDPNVTVKTKGEYTVISNENTEENIEEVNDTILVESFSNTGNMTLDSSAANLLSDNSDKTFIEQRLKENDKDSQNNSQELPLVTDTYNTQPYPEYHESSFTNTLSEQTLVDRSHQRTSQSTHSSSSHYSETEGGIELSNCAETNDQLHIPDSPKHSPSISSTSSNREDNNLLSTSFGQERRQSSTSDRVSYSDRESVSDSSDFFGSLGIDVDFGEWSCENDVDLDIRLGRDEWSTVFKDTEGDTTQGSWDTSICEIAKSKADSKDWETSLQDISHHDHEVDRQAWKTAIPENMEHTERPEHWSTKINTIEKVNPITNTWNTVFNKIKEHVSTKKEWKTTFNTIGKNVVNKNEWKFKIPEKMTNNSKKEDWKTRINKLGVVTSSTDPWQFRDTEMLVTSDDRQTHWNTAFKEIAKQDLSIEQWQTILRNIAPVGNENSWAFKLVEMSNDLGSPEDWRIKFLSIAENLNVEKNWSTMMNDVPNSYREVTDWETTFKSIEEINPEDNPWNCTFNDIDKNGDESHLWTNTLNEPDITDMSRETWDSTFNDIMPNEPNDLDWTVTANPIEGVVE